MDEKQCTGCKRNLDKSQFSHQKGGKDGLHSKCRECVAKAKKEWDVKNLDHIKEYRKKLYAEVGKFLNHERYLKYRESLLKRSRKYYQTHKIEAREKHKIWIENNRDHLHQYEVIRYINEREEMAVRNKKWRQEHPLRRSENESRRKALIKKNTVEKVSYESILVRDGYVCHICKESVLPNQLSFDHVIPVSKGGPHAESNIKVAHLSCNIRKKDRIQP